MRRWLARLASGLACALIAFSAAPALAQERCPSAQALDAAPLQIRGGDAAALASFMEAPQCHHWVSFYFAAERLYEAGRRDEAARWFYVGQMRGRVTAVLDNGSTRMLVDALQHIVGQPVNEHAGRSRRGMVDAIDWAAAWDRQNPQRLERLRGLGASLDFSGARPLPFQQISPRPSQSQFDAVYAQQRAGMNELRNAILSVSAEQWREMRRQNGLETDE